MLKDVFLYLVHIQLLFTRPRLFSEIYDTKKKSYLILNWITPFNSKIHLA